MLFLGPSDLLFPRKVETTLKTKTTPSGSKRGNGETGGNVETWKRGSGVGEKPERA